MNDASREPVVVRAVGLRDGLREIEVGSFVPAKLMPQLADIARIVDLRDARGSDCRVEVGLSTAFGCTIQGRVEPGEVLRLVHASIDAGVDAAGLADTVGYADALAVRTLFERAREVAGDKLSTAHFHDTRGLGSANLFAAWQAGIRRFDACTAGLGGCPHAPGASGNVATEDVAYLFASMGVPTGLDFDALMALRERVGRWLDGEPLHGAIWRAGLPKTLKAGA
jgi:hydroxymethylglutaryl-CoA lyase